MSELNTFHKKYLKEQFNTTLNIQKFLEALPYLDTDFELPLDLVDSYDKRLMYVEKNKIWSLFPTAKRVLLANLESQSDFVEKMVTNYLELKLVGSGYPIEFYIIYTMKQLSRNNQILYLEMRDIHEVFTKIYEFNIKRVEDLINIPLQKPTVTTLYVPINPRYPAIDCLIYDARINTIFPIQITLNQKNHKDSYKEWQENYQAGWNKVFNCESQFVWLAGVVKTKINKKNDKYFVSTFQSLPIENKGCFTIFNKMAKELDEKAQCYTDGSMILEDDNE